MDEKLMAELETLKKGLEGKTQAEVKSAMEAFEVSVKKSIENETKAVKEAFEVELKSVKESLDVFAGKDSVEAMQKHLDQLDIKVNAKQKQSKEVKKISFDSGIKSELESNFEEIKTVRKGKSTKIEVKAVADMTLGNNLTGDAPRSYSQTVVPITAPLLNFSDLLGAPINIDGGTYTFPKEVASEGAVAFQTEGSAKGQIDYDFEMVDVTTDFLAGVTTYSKKMSNNLPFLQSFIPSALRRDYMKQENIEFNTTLSSSALASTQLQANNGTKIEQIMKEIATLESLDNPVTGIVVTPSDWWDIQATEKSTGAGFGLPGVVSYTNGTLFLNGIPVFKATWLAANKYYVGDWTRIRKVVTEGLSLEFSNEDKDNFSKNNITARIEAQIGLVIERDTAIIYGDFTAA